MSDSSQMQAGITCVSIISLICQVIHRGVYKGREKTSKPSLSYFTNLSPINSCLTLSVHDSAENDKVKEVSSLRHRFHQVPEENFERQMVQKKKKCLL